MNALIINLLVNLSLSGITFCREYVQLCTYEQIVGLSERSLELAVNNV